MTSIMDVPAAQVHRAVEQAEQVFTKPSHTDFVMERRVIVHSLTRAGYTAKEIAAVVGIKERQVVRTRKMPLPADLPLPTPEEIPVDREAELVKLAEVVTGLAWRLRDEDPRVVRTALQLLGRETLEELAVIALIGLPIDQPITEVFGWVLELPAAQEEQK